MDGPFSSFPGVDRILTVLDGGLRLTVDDRSPVILTPQTRPKAFPGDVATWGALEAGPVLDLNVMSRRGQIRASLRRLDVLLPQVIDRDGESQLLIAGLHGLRVRSAATAHDLGPYDAMLFQGPAAGLLIEAAKPSTAHLATFQTV